MNEPIKELLAECETFENYDGYMRAVPEGFTDKVIQAWWSLKSLEAALLLACERIADGPQDFAEAKTAEDWADSFIAQSKQKEVKA